MLAGGGVSGGGGCCEVRLNCFFFLLNRVVPPSDAPQSLSPWYVEFPDVGGEAGLEKKHLLFGLDNKQKQRMKQGRRRLKSVCINRERQTEAGLLVKEGVTEGVRSQPVPSSSSPQPSATPASS